MEAPAATATVPSAATLVGIKIVPHLIGVEPPLMNISSTGLTATIEIDPAFVTTSGCVPDASA